MVDKFQNFCNKLAASPHKIAGQIAYNPELAMVLHGAIGASTETGEILDIVKKELIYGRIADPTHMKEEIGDVLHYLTYICKVYGFSIEDCMESNIRKLEARYPNGFTSDSALNRNLGKEREALA